MNNTEISEPEHNTYIGAAAGANHQEGNYNLFIGDGAGQFVEKSNNRLIIRTQGVLIDKQLNDDDARMLNEIFWRILNT